MDLAKAVNLIDLDTLDADERWLIEEMVSRQINEPLLSTVPLTPSQGDFLISDAMRLILRAGNQTGKTMFGALKSALYVLDCPRTWDDDKLRTFWICATTWEAIGEIIWKPHLSRFIQQREMLRGRPIWHNKAKQWPSMIQLANGWQIVFKSYEQGREGFQGSAIRGCWADEQIPEDINGELMKRLLTYNAPFWQTVTPINPDPILQRAYHEQREGWEFLKIDLNETRVSVGGWNPDDVIDREILETPEEWQPTRISGEFFGFQGAVYPGFSRKVHVCEPFDIPTDWRRVCGIDFGFNNPFVCLWCAIDDDGTWYVFHEHRAEKQNIDIHARAINKVDEWAVPLQSHLKRYWDPGDTAGVSVNGRDYRASGRAELRDRGINGENARKDIMRGIERLARMLRPQENGQPRLKIFSSCKGLIGEMETYGWPSPAKSGNRSPEDRPMKVNDHGPDALRYAVFSYVPPATGRTRGVERRNVFARPESSFTREGASYG